MLMLHVVLALAAGCGLILIYRWVRRQSPRLGAIVAAGYLLQTTAGLALFWISHLDLPLLRGLHSMRGAKTLIMIAHRLTTVQGCDRLYVLDDGRIVDQGSFAELVQRGKSVDANGRPQRAVHAASESPVKTRIRQAGAGLLTTKGRRAPGAGGSRC
jgi:hypothetical protein